MNKVYLLDTNIVSEFSKERPNQTVLALYEARKNLCAISSITFQEMVYGVTKMPEGKKKKSILGFIEGIKNNVEILPYDDFSADICGKALGTFEKSGQPLPMCDTQIAATAISKGMVLVTHNTSDFEPLAERCFLRMEDWFEG
ncbi:MAG: type II toxin-antitoxin system VapC family toxin [Treponema sp.]|nr:type II toxin-antitoxin system VapC family toxin [Treponema sp.]